MFINLVYEFHKLNKIKLYNSCTRFAREVEGGGWKERGSLYIKDILFEILGAPASRGAPGALMVSRLSTCRLPLASPINSLARPRSLK